MALGLKQSRGELISLGGVAPNFLTSQLCRSVSISISAVSGSMRGTLLCTLSIDELRNGPFPARKHVQTPWTKAAY